MGGCTRVLIVHGVGIVVGVPELTAVVSAGGVFRASQCFDIFGRRMTLQQQGVSKGTLVRQVLELLPEAGVLIGVHARHVVVERTDWN